MGEVGVFDRADADGAGDFALLFGGHAGGGLLDDVERAAFGFVEEEVEFDGGAGAGGEQALGQAHEAEPDVAQAGLDAGFARNSEELAEVKLLAFVGDVDDGVGLEFFDAGEDGGEVGGGVVVAAVGFAHDAGGQLVVVEEGDESAFALANEAEILEFGDHAGEGVVVVGLAADEFKADAEAVVDAVEFGEREVYEGLPEGAVVGVAGLEFDEFKAGLVLPFGVVVALLVGEDIDALEFVNGGGVESGGVEEVAVAHDEDAELGAPVAEMVVADDAIAEGAVDALEGIADDGRADVGDVHGFGDVGGGVVEEDGFAKAGLGDAEGGGGVQIFKAAGEGGVGQGQVDEAGAGHFDAGEEVVAGELVGDALGDVARREAQEAGGGHGGVALVVAEGVVGGGDGVGRESGKVGFGEDGGEGGAEAGGEDVAESWHGGGLVGGCVHGAGCWLGVSSRKRGWGGGRGWGGPGCGRDRARPDGGARRSTRGRARCTRS